MDHRSLKPAIVLIAAAAVAGCSRNPAPDEAADVRQQPDATIIDESHLERSGGNVLNILPSYVAGLRVSRTESCPKITMRGSKSLLSSNDPVVYVDGTRTGNTCILDTLVPSEVERIEVYPMGVTTRPGYRNSPNGLILVFMKTTDGA